MPSAAHENWVVLTDHDYLVAASQMRVQNTYKRRGAGYGIDIHSDAMQDVMSMNSKAPNIVDRFIEGLARRLNVPANQWDFGIDPDNHSFRIAPQSAHISPQQLTTAVNAEIAQARARLATKHLGLSSVDGTTSPEEVSLIHSVPRRNEPLFRV